MIVDRRPVGACAILLALASSGPAFAQAADTDELAALVRQQAAEIEGLKQRIAKLEQNASVPLPSEAPPAPQASSRASPPKPRLAWTGAAAPSFSSPDGQFSFHPRGRMLLDVTATMGSRYDTRNYATTAARALRLGADGMIGGRLEYLFEADFSQDSVNVLNAYIGWRSPLSRNTRYELRFGNNFLDRGVDSSTGPDSVPFLDRNTVGTSIAPQQGFYGFGVLGTVSGRNWHVSASITGDDIDGKTAVGDSLTGTIRAHWDPVSRENGFLHLGGWLFQEKLSSAIVDAGRASQIGGRFNTMLRIESGPIPDARETMGYGGELGTGFGSAWLMAEAGQRRFDVEGLDPIANAWSLSGGFFLTGEHVGYSSRTGTFVHPKIRRPLFDGGPGALEIAARYEHLDYVHLPSGGRGDAATLGANWYLNGFVRVMINYIRWHVVDRSDGQSGSDTGSTIGARTQITF